jgi:hypothetical protein
VCCQIRAEGHHLDRENGRWPIFYHIMIGRLIIGGTQRLRLKVSAFAFGVISFSNKTSLGDF